MINIDITQDCADWEKAMEDISSLAEQTISTALTKVPAMKNKIVEVSLVLTDDVHIKELNKKYRFKDKATNVLSFPQIDWTEPTPAEKMLMLGDIILAFETIQREAKEQNKTLEHHTQHLLVHGAMHLCGYDHEEDEDAEIMENLETAILQELGIKNPYLAA